ncbi:MAG: MarR family winged helix-turn-helix transcriptional regulator [Actinomycetota bacterium]|nr:MarR family winged helix-turn-helix transcriptional regulator [Actinomycetota bacterium]
MTASSVALGPSGGGTMIPALRGLVRASRALERVSPELSLPQYRLLSRVAAGDERATDLAGRLDLAKPTITAMVDSLVCRGLLGRGASTGDRRVTRLEVSPEGRAALEETEAAMAVALNGLVAGCYQPEVVVAALAELGRVLDARLAARRQQPDVDS